LRNRASKKFCGFISAAKSKETTRIIFSAKGLTSLSMPLPLPTEIKLSIDYLFFEKM
jgi:hypothetical protein